VLPSADRDRIAPLAADAKDKALSLRGASDRPRAEAELRGATETLVAALVETAEADPKVDEEEVRRLRDDLRRELDRLATADKGFADSAQTDLGPLGSHPRRWKSGRRLGGRSARSF
jgi:hypothetical protein